MKKIIIVTVTTAFFSGAFAQSNPEKGIELNTLPPLISQSFNNSYSNLQGVIWLKRSDSVYVASYIDNETAERHIVYHFSGKIISNEREVRSNELPSPITTTLNTQYKAQLIGKIFEVIPEVGSKTYSVTVNEQKLQFTEEGNLMPEKK